MSIGAYTIWGLCVVLLKWLGHVPMLEVTAHRVVWSLVFIVAWISLQGRWGEVARAASNPRILLLLAVTASLIAANWLIFIWAVTAGHVLELSFGYFFCPILVVAIGTLLDGERLLGKQPLVLGLTVVAVAIQGLAIGRLPLFALTVGLNFAVYTYVRKKVHAAGVQSVPGFFIECLLMSLVAVPYVLWLEGTGAGHFTLDQRTALLLMATISVTALPLILFASSNGKLRLVTTGILQYITPSLQFLLALFVYGEAFDGLKLFTFSLIWAALTLFTWDAIERERAKALAQTGEGPLAQLPIRSDGWAGKGSH
jgi:chloramphenicol-sensitive protein RarD